MFQYHENTERLLINIKYPEVGVCGLSCRLCPNYNTDAASRCQGCKSHDRIAVGCPFLTCALKKKGVEFCWDCKENSICEKWKMHREAGKKADSFKCYQKLEDDIAFIQKFGTDVFEELQKEKEQLLKEMLIDFNEGRSKSYYCIAATVMETTELRQSIDRARQNSSGMDKRQKSGLLHSILDEVAHYKQYCLKLRR